MVMMPISISAKRGTLEEVMLGLKNKQHLLPVVVSRSLNKTASWVQTRVVKGVSSEVAIKQADIRKGIRIYKASTRRLRADVTITGKRIPLIKFGAKQNKKGVSYRIGKGSKRTSVPGAFITQLKTGHKGAFVRVKAKGGGLLKSATAIITGRMKLRTVQRIRAAEAAGLDRVGRLPIKELMGPSVPAVAQHAPGLLAQTLEEAGERNAMEMRRQVSVLIAQGKVA